MCRKVACFTCFQERRSYWKKAPTSDMAHWFMVRTSERTVWLGMNAVVMDDVRLGEGCVVGALAMVKASTSWPDRSLILGNPATLKGEVSDLMLQHKSEGTALYQDLPADLHVNLKEVEPLSAEPASRVEDFPVFDAWHKRKDLA